MAAARSRLVLVVFALGVLGLLLYLVHDLAPRSQTAANEPQRGPAGSNPMFAAPRPATAPAGTPAPVPDDQVPVIAPPPPGQAPLAEVIDHVRERVVATAAACKLEPAHPDERVTLRYRVSVRAGELGLTDVTLVDSTFSDDQLRDCVVDEVVRLHWKVDGTDSDTPVDHVVVLGQLMAARGMEIDPEAYPAPQPPEAPLPQRPRGVPDSK